MDKQDTTSEMKTTNQKKEDGTTDAVSPSTPTHKNGMEKSKTNNPKQIHSEGFDKENSKEKENSKKEESKENSRTSTESNERVSDNGQTSKAGKTKGGEKEGNASKGSTGSTDKTENGLENPKANNSKSSNASSSANKTDKKPATAGGQSQQQSSLLLAKLANQQDAKKTPTGGKSVTSGGKPVSAVSSNAKSNSSYRPLSFLPRSYYSPSLSIIDEDTKLPTSSIQQIEAIRNETLLHSMSTKAQRILKAKAKAELLKKIDEKLGPLASFLNGLGLDIVKQSVYHEAIHIQSRKQQAGKLSDIECSQLDKMRSSCKELAEKLKHLKLSYRKCRLCNFVSESVNVHFWHREHPHINSREDFCCSYCDFVTRNNVAFNFHMEAEHNIKGRSMDKPSFWQCTLCPFEHNSKSKLTQHKFKCEKNFEMKNHLSPSPDTDINYSLYGVFYLSEKEETLKAIALHKAKQAQLKAQQAQYKLQQQQAAVNRANYFNASKVSPIQPKPLLQGSLGQRIPVMVHPKIGSSLQGSAGSLLGSNRFQGSLRQGGGQSKLPIKPFSSGLSANSARIQSVLNANKSNLNLMQSQLPVKDLINIHQAIKAGQNVVTAKSLANQKLIPSNSQPTSDVSEFEICELCGGYVKDRDALRIHFFYAHRVEMPALMFDKPAPPLFCDVCDKKCWTSQGLQKHRVSLKHYAKGSLSQVCILCGCLVSHLLNHMTDTHQLNLQDFLNQKRCIVCGKVCLSRSETEIHMAASHGILVKRTNANSSETKAKSEDKGGASPVTMVTKGGSSQPSLTSSTSQLVKGNYCVFCKVPFASNAELTQHCLLVHKACKKCGMVLPGEGSLGSHKCQISIPTVKACSVCKQEILIQEFIKHVEEKHLKKCSIKLKRLNSDDIHETKGGQVDGGGAGSKGNDPNKKRANAAEQSRKRKTDQAEVDVPKKQKLLPEESDKAEAIAISDDDDDDDDDGDGGGGDEQQEEEEEGENINDDCDDDDDDNDNSEGVDDDDDDDDIDDSLDDEDDDDDDDNDETKRDSSSSSLSSSLLEAKESEKSSFEVKAGKKLKKGERRTTAPEERGSEEEEEMDVALKSESEEKSKKKKKTDNKNKKDKNSE